MIKKIKNKKINQMEFRKIRYWKKIQKIKTLFNKRIKKIRQ